MLFRSFTGTQLQDRGQQLDVRVQSQKNLTDVRQQAAANREYELRREELRTEDAGRSDPLYLWAGLRAIQAAGGQGGNDQAATDIINVTNAVINKNRTLSTDDN